MRYIDRIPLCRHPLAKKILQLMDDKKTNLALSADVTQADDLLDLANQLGSEIVILKTHIDILTDFKPAITTELKKLSKKHHFFIFEDRKFADIGATVKLQYEKGIYHIVEWADIVNAHSLPGPGIIKALGSSGIKKQRGLLLLAEMSSEGNLLDPIYAQRTLEMAQQFPQYVMGFISQTKLDNSSEWIYMTPGVKFSSHGDEFGQQYITPRDAIVKNGSDIIIVGRGILSAKDPLSEAKRYREAGWEAYLEYFG